MKKIILIIPMLIMSLVISAQDIGYAEYFIDTDPGYGKATSLNITSPASEFTLNFDVNTSSLSNGWHFVGIRAKNVSGKWGSNCNRLFYLIKLPSVNGRKISKVEYFIDTDPGIGKGTQIAVNSQYFELTLNATADLIKLNTGMHYLGIRCADASGRWGIQTNRIFYYNKISALSAKISKAEYFIDTDPGFGKAKQFTVSSPGSDLVLDVTDDLSNLEKGMHNLVIRAADANGRWGTSVARVFYYVKVPTSAKIDKAEYFIDTDPGFGKAKQFTVASPNNELTLNITEDLVGIEQGMHQIVVRARDLNGKWGPSVQRIFYFLKKPVASLANISQIEYFYDNDPGFGKGTPVSVASPGLDINLTVNAVLTGLTQGNHMVYIRAKNAANQWGQVYAEAFSYTITGIGTEKVVSLFKIYPNPNKGEFKIQFPEYKNERLKVRIMDMAGKTIVEKHVLDKLNEFSLEIPKGIYLIHVENGNKVFSQKLCIE